jgi:hypothetical protein
MLDCSNNFGGAMNTFTGRDDVLFLFALTMSAIVVCTFYYFVNLINRKSEKDLENGQIILDTLFSCITSEWIFVDRVIQNFYESGDQKIAKALDSMYGENIKIQPLQVSIVDNLLASLEKNGLVEIASVKYSRENITRHPKIFEDLPDWRKIDCETVLMVSNQKRSGETLMQVRRVAKDEITRAKIMRDLGMNVTIPYRNLE